MARPISLQIHIDALRHNLAVVRRQAPNAQVWAVAKAHGYGHGIDAAVRGFGAADGLAVLDLQEAEQARMMGWDKPILMIEGPFSRDELVRFAALRLESVMCTPPQMEMLQTSDHLPTRVWVKFNTGMNRLGFSDQLSDEDLMKGITLIAQRVARPIGLMTHFSDADSEQGWCDQAARFKALTERISERLPLARGQGPRSMANSAATLCHPQTHADWVRPGIALYGASPFEGQIDKTADAFGLRAGQSLMSQLVAVQTIQAGESVGYGSRWIAKRPSRIGVIACGYGDGYPRSAPDGTPVCVADVLVPLAGRVSMDLLTVDLTDHPGPSIGDPVELWGHRVAIDEVATRSGTIGYELMTGVTSRVPRVLLDA